MAKRTDKENDGSKPLENKMREMFCQEYMRDFIGAQACIRAGFKCKSDNVARATASRLLTNVNVMKRIEFLSAERTKQIMVDKAFVIEGFKEIARRSLQAVPVMEWDAEKMCFVEKKDLIENPDTGEQELRTVYAYNAKEANKAYENIAKYSGVVQEIKKVEHNGVIGVAEVPLTKDQMVEKAQALAKYLGEEFKV